jgi:hypothetical protein
MNALFVKIVHLIEIIIITGAEEMPIMLLWKQISKDDLMVSGVVRVFWELGDTYTSGSLFTDRSLNQAKYHAQLSNEISNFLDEMSLTVFFEQNQSCFIRTAPHHIKYA